MAFPHSGENVGLVDCATRGPKEVWPRRSRRVGWLGSLRVIQPPLVGMPDRFRKGENISVDEALKRVRVPDQHGYYGRDYRIENHGTGELRLQIEQYFDIPLQRRWRDTPERPLEHQLRDVLIGLFFAASVIRRERLEAEASACAAARAEALREAERKKREAEHARVDMLKRQTSDWALAQAIRKFVAAAQRSPHQRGPKSALRT